MKSFARLFLYLNALFVIAPQTGFAGFFCKDILAASPTSFLTPVDQNLFLLQAADMKKLSYRQIRNQNKKTQQALESYKPPMGTSRASSVSLEELQAVLNHLENSTVNPDATNAYQREDAEVGYCFGRATYVHLLLLKMGLQKESILKVWAVGPQKNTRGGKPWGHHVAPAVYVRGYGWMTVDLNAFKIQPLRHWFSHYSEGSLDDNIRFYVTPAQKFGASTGAYDRVQMGLDLTKEQDWFKHYFVDMLESLKQLRLESVGLQKIKLQ